MYKQNLQLTGHLVASVCWGVNERGEVLAPKMSNEGRQIATPPKENSDVMAVSWAALKNHIEKNNSIWCCSYFIEVTRFFVVISYHKLTNPENIKYNIEKHAKEKMLCV